MFWDESCLWGLMSYRALKGLGLAFELVSAEDIKAGALENVQALFVPGGWASNKIKALGDEGVSRIREFVSEGGIYIGLCGGAGLATTSGGLGLLDISRRPLNERVPSLSGPVRLKVKDESLLPDGAEPVYHIWWPSQFVINDPSIKTLAFFDEATAGAFSSDINVGLVVEGGWRSLEENYGINLDPERMKGDPVIVEGDFGKGKVLASLVHLDTPECVNGGHVLTVLWERFKLRKVRPSHMDAPIPSGQAYESLSELFDLGVRDFLWFRRGDLVQWRRGVRGLEYFTLMELARELAVLDEGACDITLIKEIEDFTRKAGELLSLEATAIRNGEPITFAKASGKKMEGLRLDLFGKGKSHGGLYKEILNRLDSMLYERLLDAPLGEETVTGRVHIYTGDGKGKTTASVGLAVRAKSRGLRVLYAQFMKTCESGELEALQKLGVKVLKFSNVRSPVFFPEVDSEENRRAAISALEQLKVILHEYDLVVIDEFFSLLSREIISEREGMEFLGFRPENVELVLTGRDAPQLLIEVADIVTDMSALKHPYADGVRARSGIEY